MKRFTIILTGASLILSMMLLSSGQITAQEPDAGTAVNLPVNYDPIAETLDSLVNLNYLQRQSDLSQSLATNGTFHPEEIPSYSDDIYRGRIAKIQTPIPLAFNQEVKDYIELYAMKKRALTERVMGLANLYFPLYEQILDQQGLPLEFKYLSIVESALNPMAVSRVGATGLWQFMLSTGKMYKLKVNSYIDERKDPVASTYAACQYFKDMYSIYNDWLLVIAAYNCGAGNVNKAIARSGGKTNFWEISPYLPRETRGYVPAFIAVTYLLHYSAEHNLNAVQPLISYFECDTVLVDHKISLRDVANSVGMAPELVSYLNPVYKKGIIPDADQPLVLRLPSNRMNSYLANVERMYQASEEESSSLMASAEISDVNFNSMSSNMIRKVHHVKRGEHLQSIAHRYKCSVSDIKEWNNLKSSRLVSGQKLKVYVQGKKKTNNGLALQNSPSGSAQPAAATGTYSASVASVVNSTKALKTIYHVVQPGDTLWKIAQSYEGATVEKIKKINQLSSNDLKVGTRLKVVISGT